MTSWINPKIEVKKTEKTGLGSFAKEKINSGEIVIVQGGKILSYDEILNSDYKVFSDHCFQVEEDLLICPITPSKENLDGIFHINHSCEPNCGVRGQITFVAMRDIQEGEEITYDYAMTDANFKTVSCTEMECLCSTKNCRKIITGNDWKDKKLQEKYKGFFSNFIQRLIDENQK